MTKTIDIYGRGTPAAEETHTHEDPHIPTEDPNSLRSRSTARFIEVISEGQIVGLVDGYKSVFLNDTPMMNADGSMNFSGVSVETRDGLPTQAYIAGFTASETEVNVGVQIKKNYPVTRQITDVDANGVRIKIRTPAMSELDVDTGDLHGSVVKIDLYVKTATGSFVYIRRMTISGKSSGAYERQVRLNLPVGGAPWTFKVIRATADAATANINNDTYLSSYTILTDAKLTYPDCALVGITIDAQRFGYSAPVRAYHIDGIMSPIPTNYDPITRIYSGVWDGTFYNAWHDNPAWVMWDLLTNTRYGVGDLIPTAAIDKYGLYIISQYCDELVSDGYGGTEPRYTFNGVINSQQDAGRILDAISSSFRGMLYWGAGAVTMTHDAPGTPLKLVAPANVIGGRFSYSGSALKARHTAVFVSWNDPNDMSRRAVEVIQRDDLIQIYGWRPTEISAYGCTSRAQAHRQGQWLLDTEENETEVVVYQAALDHADVRPGQLIFVADPSYAGARYGGRIVAVTTTTLTIDDTVEIKVGETYSATVVLDDGSLVTNDITNSPATGVSVLTLADAYVTLPETGAMWVITASDAEPRTFRVISNTEKENNIYEIIALFHDTTKYARIEQNINLEDPQYSEYPTGPLAPPTDLTLVEYFDFTTGTGVPTGLLSWGQSPDARATTYEIHVQGPNDVTYRSLGEISTVSTQDILTSAGSYTYRVRTKAPFTAASQWVELTQTLLGPNLPISDVENFAIAVSGDYATLTWDTVTDAHLDKYVIRYSSNTVGATWDTAAPLLDNIGSQLVSALVPARVGTYFIKASTITGVLSANAGVIISTIAGALEFNTVECIDDAPTWAGTHDNTTVNSGELRLGDASATMDTWGTLDSVGIIGGEFYPNGTYTLLNRLDLGDVYQVDLTAELDAAAITTGNTMDTWGTLDSLVNLTNVSTSVWDVTIECRQTDDDPDLVPTWSAWVPFVVKAYTARAWEFRIKLSSTVAKVTPVVRSLNICADMQDRIDAAPNIDCPVDGIQITFDQPFMAVPSVFVDGQALNTGDYFHVTDKQTTGFYVQFFNSSDTAKAVTFDWLAKGYGRLI